MNSYKCPQCGLVNWSTADCCKRCKLPNQYHPNNQQIENDYQNNQNFSHSATMATPTYETSYRQPQSLNQTQFNNYQNPQYGQNRQNFNNYQYQQNNVYSAEVNDKIVKAEKQVRDGWRAGLVWSILLGIGSLAFLFFASFAKNSSQLPSSAAKEAANAPDVPIGMFMGIMALILAFFAFLIGGLSYGIKLKSKVCAIILIVISSLGILNSLIDKNAIGGLFALLFLVAFCYSLQGINTLKNYNA